MEVNTRCTVDEGQDQMSPVSLVTDEYLLQSPAMTENTPSRWLTRDQML
jgi:hypothetical protein